MNDRAEVIKVIVVGDGAVGKTSIVRRFTTEKFEKTYFPTVGANFYARYALVDNKRIVLQIWDLAGQPRFNEVTQLFFRGARGVVYVFDRTRPITLKNLENWFNRIYNEIGKVPSVVAGNKTDLVRSTNEYDDLAKRFSDIIGAQYFLTSAKEDINIEQLFIALIKSMFQTEKIQLL
ncbi:MAG: Rab family GTPase [Candidatus Asgardarchaeum sp.]|nr:GTP-binding protein [Candidatus Odinarchaeota archaeon]